MTEGPTGGPGGGAGPLPSLLDLPGTPPIPPTAAKAALGPHSFFFRKSSSQSQVEFPHQQGTPSTQEVTYI